MMKTQNNARNNEELVYNDNEEIISGGNTSKVGLILLLSLITLLSLAQNLRGNNFLGASSSTTSSSARSSYTPLITSIYNNSSYQSTSSYGRSNNSQRQRVSSMSKDDLPIYLIQSANNNQTYAQITWSKLAKQWNRTAQYEDIFQLATPTSSLPFSNSASSSKTLQQQRRRVVVMIHCGPKTGSTTLRRACKINLEHTCGIRRNTTGHYPVGYMDETKLYPLIRQCINTTHFCAKEVVMPSSFDIVPRYENALFVHMFPFRMYDEWARSALKQQYDARGSKGCNTAKSLLEECKHNRMEIDFRKYGKTELSKFKEGVVQRMNLYDDDDDDKKKGTMIMNDEQHVFLLYHHRELNRVLETLSVVYDIPLLPGSDGKGKEVRPEGTCVNDTKLLQMFHDCFSSELMELT